MGVAHILGMAGSLRRGSYNGALLRAAAALAPAGTDVDIASIREIPLYDGDVEAEGLPPAVAALKQRLAAADALLLVTPEYNHSMPGVLKNVVDWLSRPAADIPRVFGDKPAAVIGATPGARGTIMAQTAWLPVLRTLGMRPWFGQTLYVAGAARLFDAAGELVDPPMRERVAAYMAGFAEFVQR